jgi:hypothetical protein
MKNNIRIKIADTETRPPKSPEGGLQDRANLAEHCFRTSFIPLLAGSGGVIITVIER